MSVCQSKVAVGGIRVDSPANMDRKIDYNILEVNLP